MIVDQRAISARIERNRCAVFGRLETARLIWLVLRKPEDVSAGSRCSNYGKAACSSAGAAEKLAQTVLQSDALSRRRIRYQ
jgi:hypothetical protein